MEVHRLRLGRRDRSVYVSEQQALTVAETEKVEATKVVQWAASLRIDKNETAQATVTIIQDIKVQHAKVDALRRSFTDPIRLSVERLNDFFRPALESYLEAEKVLKWKVLLFQEEQAKERERLLQAAVTENPEGAAHAIAVAEQHLPEKMAGMSVRTEWVGEVTDASLIPREFLCPDLAKLNAVTKAGKADPGIAGWRAWSRQVAAVKR